MTCRSPTASSSTRRPRRAGSSTATCPSDAAIGASFQTGITMFDAQGVEQKVFYNLTKTAANTWTVKVDHADGSNLQTVTGVTFSAAGALTSPAAPGLLATFNPNTVAPAGRYPSWNNNVQIDISGLTQFGGAEHPRRPGAGRLRPRLAAVLPARRRRHDHGRLLQRAPPAHRAARARLLQQPRRPGEGRQQLVPGRRELRCGARSGRRGSADAVRSCPARWRCPTSTSPRSSPG